MNTTKISHVAHLVEICVQHGVSQVVISPGSRNAPLVIAFDSHPKIETFLIHDERSAAFFAMGLAEESGRPVAITCTSGSAPVNYAPAVVESYYRNIPLLVLTADRPVELVDQGDGQTIRQKNLFDNFIKAEFELPNFPSAQQRIISDELVNKALIEITTVPLGPVHINIPLAEPLYETQLIECSPIISTAAPIQKELTVEEKGTIKDVWTSSVKKMVLIGQFKPNELNTELLKPILSDPSVAILVESTSNIHDFERICHCIDRTLAIIKEDEITSFAPGLLVTFGNAIISKKIKAFLRKNKPVHNWRIGEFLFEQDTYQSLTASFNIKAKTFLSYIGNLEIVPVSNYGNKWKQRDFLAEESHNAFLQNAPYSDHKVFDLILDTLPHDTNLHMANSSVVRYCQLYNPIRGIQYYCNRGVSGIDGSTSTAVGIANASLNKLNLIISGDVSFFYDSNALWNAYLPSNFRMIVINNGGGGIFNIIDGPRKSKQSNYFVAPFEAKIHSICEAFNVHHMKVGSLAELENAFESFYTISTDERPILLEVDTQAIDNAVILKDYFTQIAESI